MDRPDLLEQRPQMPMLKKYLPMYQSPALIEELKAHDRMRLIREREAMNRRLESPPRSPGSVSVRPKLAPRTVCYFPGTVSITLLMSKKGYFQSSY